MRTIAHIGIGLISTVSNLILIFGVENWLLCPFSCYKDSLD